MATVPNPRTWVSEQVTDAKLNADIRDSFNFFKSPPLAILRRSSDLSVPVAVATVVPWDVEIIDRDGGHSNVTNPSRYTSQTAGWYFVNAKIFWHQDIVAGFSWADTLIRKNSATNQSRNSFFGKPGTVNAGISVAEGYVQLAVNDYIEITVNCQNASGNSSVYGQRQWFKAQAWSQLTVRWVTA